MKKCAIVIIAMFFAVASSAQNFFEFGPKASINFSQFSTNVDDLKSSMKSGFDAGLFFRIGKTLYVQPEVLFAFKSSNLEDAYHQLKDSIKSSSIDVPILLGCKLVNTSEFNLRFFAGPRFSFVVEDDFKSTYESAKFNFSGQVGLGVDILIFTLDFRYDFSLMNVAEDDLQDIKIKNNAYVLSLGLKF